MNGKNIELTRRRVLGGIVTVGAASAAAGAGTFAYFSDSETSSGNTVSAGTLNLSPESSSLDTLSFSELEPNGDPSTHSWTLTSTEGSMTGSLDVDVTISGENDSSQGTAPSSSSNVSQSDFAEALELTTLKYGDTVLTGQVDGTTTGPTQFDADSSYTSLLNLAENLNGSSGETTDNDLVNLDDPDDGTDFNIGVKLHADAGNDFQAEGIDIEFEFILNQTDGQ